MCFFPGEGPFPAVLDLCTFMSEKRACLLANRGFVVLVVAVYNDKPVNIKEMHLDCFKEAVDFLKQQPKVSCYKAGIKAVLGRLLGSLLFICQRGGFTL